MDEETAAETTPTETIEELRHSFQYGSRSNLDIKFVDKLTDAEFGDFLSELFLAVGDAVDHGDPTAIVEAAYKWQVTAYGGGGNGQMSKEYRYKYDDVPWAPMTKPLSESRVALLTSSGHFVDGHDPKPFGVENMSQQEAEDRMADFLKEPPTLTTIPSSTELSNLRVRHGGYPTRAAKADPQVVLPLRIMESLQADGVIGEFFKNAYSFVGAAAQGRLKKTIGPEWGEMLRDEQVDAVLLVPI